VISGRKQIGRRFLVGLCLVALLLSVFAYPVHFVLHDHGHDHVSLETSCGHHHETPAARLLVESRVPSEAHTAPHTCLACVAGSLSTHAILAVRHAWFHEHGIAPAARHGHASHTATAWEPASPRAPPHA
jgi:hypothetical protein